MDYLDPQQELFIKIKTVIESLGYAVYDGALPPEGTAYPFVYLGDVQQIDEANKTAVFGRVLPTIHVWSNTPRNRGTVSKILLDVKTALRKISHTQSFAWSLTGVTQRIIPDNTTKTPLLHGILNVEFHFS
mgnify:CR=1 FL=1